MISIHVRSTLESRYDISPVEDVGTPGQPAGREGQVENGGHFSDVALLSNIVILYLRKINKADL